MPKSSPIYEEVTATTTLSRMRLKELCALGPTVLFAKQGVSVELSSEFLLGLDLSENERLTLTLRRIQPNGFFIAISVNNREITVLPDTVVWFMWDGEDDVFLSCVDEESNIVSDAEHHPQSGTVRCVIRATGSYVILPVEEQKTAVLDASQNDDMIKTDSASEEKTAKKQEYGFPITAVIAIAAACAIVALLVLRRRRRG